MTGTPASALKSPQRYRSQDNIHPLVPRMTVFCDFDGPIVDVSDRYYKTYQLGLADTQAIYQAQGTSLPIRVLSKEQFWQMKCDRTPDVEIAMRSGLQQPQIEVFLQRVSQLVNQPALLQRDRLQPGVQWALALLHSRGARLVLVTLRCQTQAVQILQNYGLARLFSCIRGTQDQQAAYQNYADVKTQLLAEVIEEYAWQGLTSETAWMVGDTEADILAAQATGIPAIALTCGIRSRSYLSKFAPTQIHYDLLAAAHYLLDCARSVRA